MILKLFNSVIILYVMPQKYVIYIFKAPFIRGEKNCVEKKALRINSVCSIRPLLCKFTYAFFRCQKLTTEIT